MVTFQCEVCVNALKKKQIERHYQVECRNAYHFTCLTCWKVFDRDSIKAHTSCVTEQEKYQKGDMTNKKANGTNGVFNSNKLEIKPVDINKLKWNGFRKTSKKILQANENYRLSMNDLFDKLAQVYANTKGVDKEMVCMDLLKKHALSKLEDDSKFVIDLSKNTVRHKI